MRATRRIRWTCLPTRKPSLASRVAETELSDAVVAHLVAQARSGAGAGYLRRRRGRDSPGRDQDRRQPELPPGMAWPTRPAYPDAAQRGHRHNADRTLADSKKRARG